ncbi:MAG: nuclear transport factor 2 family protein [Paracoccaceae bacterium]
MRNFLKNAALALGLILSLTAPPAAAQDEAIHDEIRAMRDRAIAAFTARDQTALLAELADAVSFTAMNNEVVQGKPAITAYYAKMMDGASGLITDISVDFQTDALATLYAGNAAAVATGTADAAFKMRAGLEFQLPLRWSATLSHDTGAWKIASMHFSANIFDNPLDSGLRQYLWLMLAAAGLVGLVLGMLIARRRR